MHTLGSPYITLACPRFVEHSCSCPLAASPIPSPFHPLSRPRGRPRRLIYIYCLRRPRGRVRSRSFRTRESSFAGKSSREAFEVVEAERGSHKEASWLAVRVWGNAEEHQLVTKAEDARSAPCIEGRTRTETATHTGGVARTYTQRSSLPTASRPLCMVQGPVSSIFQRASSPHDFLPVSRCILRPRLLPGKTQRNTQGGALYVLQRRQRRGDGSRCTTQTHPAAAPRRLERSTWGRESFEVPSPPPWRRTGSAEVAWHSEKVLEATY